MEIPDYRQRIADKLLSENLKAFGAVCIEGPMWCGKTWTAKRQAASICPLADASDNFAIMSRVALDIDYAFKGEEPRLIDEWQVFPQIWDATRSHVDHERKHGRFILTGSATPVQKGILHSGAGRIGSMRMRPMSLWESGVSEGLISLLDAINGKDIGITDVKRPCLERIIELVLRGGWPATIDDDLRIAVKTPHSYIQRLLERDIPELDDIQRDRHKMEMLLMSLARNESTAATLTTLKRDISPSGENLPADRTINAYLNALSRLFVIENLRPFSPSMRSTARIKQAEKRHFCDPSIAAALLKANPTKLARDLHTLGFLFEGLAARDIRCYADAFGAEVYHYQDYRNREIDLILDMPNGQWAAIEVKLGVNEEEAAASNLHTVCDAIVDAGAEEPVAKIVIVGIASAAYRRKDGVYVLPITALRP